ncbi:MAG: hypothetical protein R3B84_13520 [Zavarzinella sp.]
MAMTLEIDIHFDRWGRGGEKRLQRGPKPAALAAGRVPRLAKLLALALRCEQLLASGELENYRQLAELGQVSRARISQIMNLLHLAPDIQEEILFLPRITHGRPAIILAQLQPIAATLDWANQRAMWEVLKKQASI